MPWRPCATAPYGALCGSDMRCLTSRGRQARGLLACDVAALCASADCSSMRQTDGKHDLLCPHAHVTMIQTAGSATPWPTRLPRMVRWPTCAARRRSAGRRRQACAAPASCETSASRWVGPAQDVSREVVALSGSALASSVTSASRWALNMVAMRVAVLPGSAAPCARRQPAGGCWLPVVGAVGSLQVNCPSLLTCPPLLF